MSTSYIVLEKMSNETWRIYARGINATSTKSALRKALQGQGDVESVYVAVPERSWHPQPIEVETQHRLKIG